MPCKFSLTLLLSLHFHCKKEQQKQNKKGKGSMFKMMLHDTSSEQYCDVDDDCKQPCGDISNGTKMNIKKGNMNILRKKVCSIYYYIMIK